MSWAQLLLFVHVSMAVIWVGGALMIQVVGYRVSSSGDPARLAAFGQDIGWIATRVFVPSSLLAFVTGVLLVRELDFVGFGDDWIVLGLLFYAITFVTGLLFLGPESGRVGRLTAEGSAEAGPRVLRLIFLSRLDLVLLFLVIHVMTVKPRFDDQALLEAVVAAVLAAGVIWWRYQAALTQMQSSPGPPPADAS